MSFNTIIKSINNSFANYIISQKLLCSQVNDTFHNQSETEEAGMDEKRSTSCKTTEKKASYLKQLL